MGLGAITRNTAGGHRQLRRDHVRDPAAALDPSLRALPSRSIPYLPSRAGEAHDEDRPSRRLAVPLGRRGRPRRLRRGDHCRRRRCCWAGATSSPEPREAAVDMPTAGQDVDAARPWPALASPAVPRAPRPPPRPGAGCSGPRLGGRARRPYRRAPCPALILRALASIFLVRTRPGRRWSSPWRRRGVPTTGRSSLRHRRSVRDRHPRSAADGRSWPRREPRWRRHAAALWGAGSATDHGGL